MSNSGPDADGSTLLTSPEVADLLQAAVAQGGGTLLSWELDHVDAHPQQSTTATYTAVIDWPFGRRDELLGASMRVGGKITSDERAVIFADGDREVAVWLYPRDPELPGLARAAFVDEMAKLLTERNLLGVPIAPENLGLEMIGYRPRRRAVLRLRVAMPDGELVFYVKVLRAKLFDGIRQRHELLIAAGVPAPPIALTTPDHLLILKQLPGRPLAQAIFDPDPPCTAESLIEVLDAMPSSIAQLPRRNPWTDALEQYTAMVAAAMPSLEARLTAMTRQIRSGLGGIEPGNEPTHGDFHEGQVFVAGGRISGVLDVDTVGPGRRADDLACLVAHLSTVQRMNSEQAYRVRHLIRTWVPVFDQRVNPIELRLRAAAVVLSLATGPYRSQELFWERETETIVNAAEGLIRRAA